MVTLATTQPASTWDGYDYVEACKILAGHGAAVVGLNCDRGPATMLPLIARIRGQVDCAVAAQPVAYRTSETSPTMESLRAEGVGRVFPLALDPFSCTRFEMADFSVAARDLGVNYVGHLLRSGPAPGPGHGRGARPHGAGQQVLTVYGPASGPGRRGGEPGPRCA